MRISPVSRGCEEKRYSGSYGWCGVLQQRGKHHCGDWRQSVLFIWLNQIDQTDQMNQINPRVPPVSLG
jgi:hypothetical protein